MRCPKTSGWFLRHWNALLGCDLVINRCGCLLRSLTSCKVVLGKAVDPLDMNNISKCCPHNCYRTLWMKRGAHCAVYPFLRNHIACGDSQSLIPLTLGVCTVTCPKCTDGTICMGVIPRLVELDPEFTVLITCSQYHLDPYILWPHTGNIQPIWSIINLIISCFSIMHSIVQATL